MSKQKFPIEIAHERIKTLTVKIYCAENDGASEYTLAYYDETGKRKRIVSRDLSALEARATEVLNGLASGRSATAIQADAMTAHQREEIRLAQDILGDTPLIVAARIFAEASKLIGAERVLEAAQSFRARYLGEIVPATVQEVIDQFLEIKTARGRSKSYTKRLKCELGAFAGSAPNTRIADVNQAMIQAFLDAQGGSPRSYNDRRLSLVTLFNFAKARKFIARDWDEMGGIERAEDNGGEVEIFTPEEIGKFLAGCVPPVLQKLIPFLALGAFAGLRTAEIARLDWSAINWETGYITLAATRINEDGKRERLTKTATRRIVPINDALRAWLKPISKTEGLVWPKSRDHIDRMQAQLCEAVGVKWKANALRHSYISYRLAETQDANKVALEAGNSPTMIFAHYRELVTPEQAAAWFNVRAAGGKASKAAKRAK